MGNGTGRGSSETSSSSSRAARAAAAASPVAEEKARRGTSAGSSYENSIDPPTGDDDSVAPIYSDADGQVLLRLGSEDSREFEKNGSLLFSSSSGSTDSNNEEEENRSSDELLSSSRSTVRTSGVGEGSGRPTPIMTSIGTPRFGGGGVGRTYDTPRSRDTPRSDALPHYAEQSPSSSFSHRTTPRLGNISVADGRFQRRRDRHQRQVDLTTRQAQAQTQTQAPSPQRADQVSLSQALPNGSRGGHQHLDEATMAQTAYADMSSALETTMRRKKDLRKLIQINEHRDRGGATPSPSTSAAREEVGEAAADEGRPLLHQHQRPGNHRHLTQTMTKSVFDDSISFNETIVTDNGSNHSSGPSTLAASHQRSGNHRRPTQTMMKSVLDISDSFNETTSGNTRPVGLSELHFFGGGTVSQPLNAMSPTGNSVTFGRFGDDDVSLLSGITGDFPVSPTVANIVSPGVSAEGIVRVSSSSSSVQAKLLGKISEDSHKVGDLNRKMKHTEGGRGPDDPDGGRRVAHTDTPDLRDRRGGGTGGDRSRNSAPPLKVDPNKSASHRPMAITPRSRKVLRLQQMRRNRSSGNSSSVSSRDKYESAAPIINERRRGYDAIGKDNDNCSSTVDMESLSSSSTGMYSGSAARGYLALKSEISVKPHESGPSHLEDGCEPPPPSPGGADRGMAGSSAMMGQVRSSVSPDTKENGQDQYSLGVPKTKESALELAPIGKKQAGNGSERSRYHKALNARRRLRHTQSNGRASSPSRSSSSSLSTASGRANRNLAGRLQTPSPAGHSAPSSTEGTTPRGKEQPNWRGRSHSSGAANNLGRSSGSMASSSHGDPNNSGLAPPTTQGQREPKAHQPQIGPQIPPTAHSTHQIEQIIDTEATGLPPIPPNHRGIVQSSLQRPLIQPSVNDNGFQQIDTQYDQASPSSYESSDTDDSEVQVERFPLTKSPAQPGATGQDQHRRRMKSVSVAPDSIDPEIGSIDTGRGEDCQIFELKRILQILVCGAKELPKKIFDPPGNIKDGLKCGIVDRSISQDHQDMQRLGRSESDSSLIEENDIFEGNDDSPTQPATHDHNGHNVTMPQEHTTNLAEPPISADPRRGVRRKDEGDTSTLQAQRAKRMLHGNRLISFPSNRLVDRQFMAILNDSDGRELSAIVKGMCDDPNDKFRTVIFSQHDPSVCKAVFGALTKERLGDLDENAKVSLIRVLAIGNNQSDAFRFMARLWTSINQRNRVLCEQEFGPTVAAWARRCCTEDIDAFPKSLWELHDVNTFKCLATDDLSNLPTSVQDAGETAIDEIAQIVLSFFPDFGMGTALVGSTIIDDLLIELGLASIRDELNWKEADKRFPDVATFVLEVSRTVKLNPILITFGASWTSMDAFSTRQFGPEITENMEADVRFAVAYCFLHFMICSAFIHCPRSCDNGSSNRGSDQNGMSNEQFSFLDRLLHSLDVKAAQVDVHERNWETSLFERNRMDLMSWYMHNIAKPMKAGGDQAKEIIKHKRFHLTAPLAILETMCENVQNGYDDNSSAGLELLIEPPGSGNLDNVLGSGPVKEWSIKRDNSVTSSGVLLHQPPFPRIWNQLFDACSIASYSMYPDFVDHLAPLLAPVLSNMTQQQERDGLFLSARFLSTHVHMHYVMSARVNLNSFSTTSVDFRNDAATQLLGLINKKAASQYKALVESSVEANIGPMSLRENHGKRIALQSLWAALKEAIVGVQSAQRVPDDVLRLLSHLQKIVGESEEKVGVV